MRIQFLVLDDVWVRSGFAPEEWKVAICDADMPYRMINDKGFVLREFWPNGTADRRRP